MQIGRTIAANAVLRLKQSCLSVIFLSTEFSFFHSSTFGLKIALLISFPFYGTGFCLNEEELKGMRARLQLARCIRDLTNLLSNTLQ